MLKSGRRYSSKVTICLNIAGLTLDVSQVVSGCCYLRNPVQVESGYGELVINVDGHEIRHSVFLPHGIERDVRQVNFF